ncbi:MAG: Ig-like domain-containing protein, partial [Planctomycetota bacterium]
ATVDVSVGGLACDYDMSGKVDLIDFSDLAWYWQATDCDGSNNFCDGTDHVGDGDVDLYDLEVFVNSWLLSLPPSVNITSPTSGTSFNSGDNVVIDAEAIINAAGTTITKVEFFEGGILLGEDTTAPYSYTWASPADGQYVLTAAVTDDVGQSSVSGPVSISIGAASPVVNGGFETGDLTGWTTNHIGGNSTSTTDADARSGSYSLKLVTSSTGAGVKAEINQTVTGLYGSNSYDLELWVKGLMDVGGVAWAQIQWLNGSGGFISSTELINLFAGLSNSTYQSRGGTWTTPAGTASANISIRLEGGAMVATNTMYVDDVSFE